MRKDVWLNWACLGASSTELGALGWETRELELVRALRSCIAWAANWTGRAESDIFLTASATEACDVLLRIPTTTKPRWLLTTNHAFSTIADAVQRQRLFLEGSTDDRSDVMVVGIDDFLTLPPKEFAERFGSAVSRITTGAPALCVLDHVTSLHGHKLPIDMIEAELTARGCRVIADGAQATGIWPCPAEFNEAYFGCFHKYLNCPAGTGFGVVANTHHKYLPACVVTLAKTAGVTGSLPTQDADRWIECARRLPTVSSPTDVGERVLQLSDLLMSELGPCIPLGSAANQTYRSQILAIDLSTPAAAHEIWRHLETMGFRTKLDGHLVRVSLHHSLDVDDIKSFANALKTQVSRLGIGSKDA